MVQLKKETVTFSRDLWNELKDNPYFTELIEDIEDRAELEKAIHDHKKGNDKMISIDEYLRKKNGNGRKAKL